MGSRRLIDDMSRRLESLSLPVWEESSSMWIPVKAHSCIPSTLLRCNSKLCPEPVLSREEGAVVHFLNIHALTSVNFHSTIIVNTQLMIFSKAPLRISSSSLGVHESHPKMPPTSTVSQLSHLPVASASL